MPALPQLIKKNPILRLIEEEASAHDGDVYLVGGTLRDALLGAPPSWDFDIALSGSAKGFAAKLSRRLKATCFVLHESTQMYRIALKANDRPVAQIDVAAVQGKDIEEDLARRDFTLNALALKLPMGTDTPLDPFGGEKDIRAKTLRMTGANIFPDDPIRLLRAYRIASAFGLNIEKETEAAIKKYRADISTCAGERIRTELLGLLSAENSSVWLARMEETRLLTAIFPELEASRTCAIAYYGEGGVLTHSLDVVARTDFLLKELSRIYPDLHDATLKHIEPLFGGLPQHAALVRLAALLHDVSKPETAEKIDGRLRFFGHEARGADVSEEILERLRFSAKEKQMIATLIRHHLRPGNLAANQVISDKAVFRFFRDLGDFGISQLLLCWGDHSSYLKPAQLKKILPFIRKNPFDPPTRKRMSEETKKTLFHLQVVSYLYQRYFERPDLTRPTRFLSGDDIMKNFKIEAGPRLGEILKALEEAQAEGRVRSREDALRFVRFNFQ